MTDREKLIELLESAESAIYWNSDDRCFIEKIADYLIANGVTIHVRCKDCDYYEKRYIGFGHCNYFDNGRADNDFCSSCLRREGQ